MSWKSPWPLSPVLPAGLLVGVALVVVVTGGLWYGHERDGLLEQEAARVVAVAALKASLVSEWRAEQLTAAELLAEAPEVRGYLAASPGARRALAPQVEARLASLVGRRGVSNAAVVGRDGAVLLLARPSPFSFRELRLPVLERGSVTHSEPHRGASADTVHLGFGAPVRAHDGTILGAAALRVEAEGFLFALVRQWPGGEASGEALLVAFDGDDAILLSGTRLVPHAPLSVHLPPEALLPPGAVPFSPSHGAAVDYRGAEVVAALAPVANTQWTVLAKADQAEVVRPALRHALWLAGTSASCVLAALAMLALWWRRHRAGAIAAQLGARVKQREAEHRLETLADVSHDAVFVLDDEMRIRDVNDRAVERYGYSREELLQMRIADLRAPEVLPPLQAQWEEAERGVAFETLHVSRSGQRIPVEVSSRGFAVGDRTWRFSQVRDITRRKAQEALNAYHAMILDHLRESVISAAPDGTIRSWNKEAERLHGLTAAEAVGRPFAAAVGMPPEQMAGHLEQLLDKGEIEGEVLARRGDGSSVLIAFRTFLLRDARGQASGLVSVGRDITRRRRAEERLKLALDGTGDGLWDLDTAESRVWVSPNWATRLGLPEQECEAAREPLHTLFFPVEPEQKRAVHDHLEGLSPRYEYELRLELQGRPCWVAVRGKVVERAPDGSPARLAGTFTDVSERKAFQGKLVAADRLSSMGALAAGLAHEINNPLAYVVSNVSFACDVIAPVLESGEPLYGPDARDALKALHEAVEGAERVRRIVQDLKTFSRLDGDEKGLVDVRDSLRLALSIARSTIKHRARLETDLADVPFVEAAEHRLGQVFLNLIVNAAHAIPEGRGGEDVIRVATRAVGREVVVEVQDTGLGMGPDVLAHLFEPFFTTKAPGKGTGLGLSICHGIVTGLGGSIDVESTPGRGSTFRVRLPASRRIDRVQRPAEEAPAVRGCRLLVVDAEIRVGDALRRVLTPPHEVVHEPLGQNAVARLEAREPFDLVLCDLGQGERIIDALRATLAVRLSDGARRFVLLSAGALTEGSRVLLESGLPVIEKPFQPAALRAQISRLLGSLAAAPDAPLPAVAPPAPPLPQPEAAP